MNVRINKFKKIFKDAHGHPFQAVSNVSFGLDYGEVFGLLGVNGAGKSTTFKSITNDVTPSSGEITINSLDVRKNFNEVRKMIGYCP